MVPTGPVAGNSLTHQPMCPLRKEFPGLLLASLRHDGFEALVWPESAAIRLLEGAGDG
jgi:hypothetical protein